MVERRLGRGLDFFLTEAASETETQGISGSAPSNQAEGVEQVDVQSLVPNPEQPRRDFNEDEIRELADSIRASGLLQPILARRVNGETQIVAGERRWRAAKSIGLERVPVLVREISNEQIAVFGLVENLHRSDLNPVEKARAFRRIQELTKISVDEVARRVGLDRSTVSNFMRLLELPPEVLAHVSRGTLTMGHARALLALPGSETQRETADQIIRSGLSVRAVEELVGGLKHGLKPPTTDSAGKPKKRAPAAEAWVKECEDTLCDALDAPVAVRYGKRKSKITIECSGREDFERIYRRLTGQDS